MDLNWKLNLYEVFPDRHLTGPFPKYFVTRTAALNLAREWLRQLPETKDIDRCFRQLKSNGECVLSERFIVSIVRLENRRNPDRWRRG